MEAKQKERYEQYDIRIRSHVFSTLKITEEPILSLILAYIIEYKKDWAADTHQGMNEKIKFLEREVK